MPVISDESMKGELCSNFSNTKTLLLYHFSVNNCANSNRYFNSIQEKVLYLLEYHHSLQNPVSTMSLTCILLGCITHNAMEHSTETYNVGVNKL